MLGNILDWVCIFSGLGAIAAYVIAFLRNRPYLRPLNSLGLLLVGGALLGFPTVVGHPLPDGRQAIIVYTAGLMVGSAVFQTISAFRRRPRDRAEEAAVEQR